MKKSIDEEDYETEEEDDIEEFETSNNEKTQFVRASDLVEDEIDDDEDYEEFDDEDDEDADDEDEPQGLKEKLQFQVNSLLDKVKAITQKKKSNNNDEDEEDEVDFDDETKTNVKKPDNKRKSIIYTIIVLGLVFFIFDEFTNKEEPPVETPQAKPSSDQVVSDDTPVPLPEDTITEPPLSDENDLSLTETSPSDMSSDSIIDDKDSPDNSITSVENTDPASDIEESIPPTTPDNSIAESVPNSDEFGQGQSTTSHDPFGDLVSPIDDSDGDLTEKILQDLESQARTVEDETPTEYVAPPDYEYPGRGLVYNCKAQHWACVDGPSYKTCEQNASYQKSKEASPECYPFNIYETSRGCTSMQNRVVSSGANTDFCKEL